MCGGTESYWRSEWRVVLDQGWFDDDLRLFRLLNLMTVAGVTVAGIAQRRFLLQTLFIYRLFLFVATVTHTSLKYSLLDKLKQRIENIVTFSFQIFKFPKIGLRKWKKFSAKKFFFENFDFKNGCKNEFADNNENHAADSKIWSPLKIDFRADWTHEFIPTAWELNENIRTTFTLMIHK